MIFQGFYFLIRPLNFTQKDLCAIRILYAVEQFSLLFSKDKLKQGAHIYQDHDPPSPRMSCNAVLSQQLPHVLCGGGT